MLRVSVERLPVFVSAHVGSWLLPRRHCFQGLVHVSFQLLRRRVGCVLSLWLGVRVALLVKFFNFGESAGIAGEFAGGSSAERWREKLPRHS